MSIWLLEKLRGLFSGTKRMKVPTVLQMEAVECGAASLAMVMAYHGKFIPLEELRISCGVSRDGSNAGNVLKAAQSYGFDAEGYRLDTQEIKQITLPSIIHWNFNHFVVLEGFDKNYYYIRDPGSGPRKIDAKEFNTAFTGIALEFTPSSSFAKSGSKPDLLGALLKRAKGNEKDITYIAIAGLIAVFPGLVVPFFSKIFIDEILIGGKVNWITALVIAMVGTVVVKIVISTLQKIHLLKFGTKLSLTWSGKFFWHMLRLPSEFFTQRHSAEISSRIASNNSLASIVSDQLTNVIISMFCAVFYLILMLQYDISLTLITLSLVAFNIVYLKLSGPFRNDKTKEMIKESSNLNIISMTGLQTIETIKATASESDFFAKWSGQQAATASSYQKFAEINQWVSAIPQFITTIVNSIILLIAGLRIMEGSFTVGSFVAFQSLMASFSGPVQQIMGLAGTVQTIEGDVNRIDDVFNYKQDDNIDESIEASSKDKLEGFIEMKNVTFGYSKLTKPLIKDFNLKLVPGARVALVGASGSGKSTVAKLLTGLYKPWSGSILFDGQTRTEIPSIIRYNSIAVVDQDINVFSGTIMENLTIWDTTIPEKDVVTAAQDACIHDDITSRPGGYQSSLSEGGCNFSGGQRQRLEIARSLAINPTIFIMDEATSALDSLTEKIIDDNIRKRGVTCIIVAHRLSTIRDCDEIIVMDKGAIVERGTHNQLMQQNGHYVKLIQVE